MFQAIPVFQFTYRVGENIRSLSLTQSAQSAECDVVIETARDRVSVNVQAHVPISDCRAAVVFPANVSHDTRIFLNGYQSWTDSKEFFPDETLIGLRGHSKWNRNFGASGDYKIVGYSGLPGSFHSFSYFYLRDDFNVRLFASMGEQRGFTCFHIDAPMQSISVTKDLEGVTIEGEYSLFNLRAYEGGYDEVFDRWFGDLQIAPPRVTHSTGYTSWYNYYTNISQRIIENDLRGFVKNNVKIDIFQIDDGYQTKVGDWCKLKPSFADGMRAVSDGIHDYGAQAGIWLAPFSCKCDSDVARSHPEWLVCDDNGKPILAGLNWGGFYALDLEKEAVKEHVKSIFDTVFDEWNFDLVKLDFLYCVCMQPRNNKSRGQLMCEAMDFIRQCCRDKLILGCGVPLMPAFGKVDYCRTGADVALKWRETLIDRNNGRERVSTPNGVNNTIFRRHLDGRAFVNDPDVYFVRDYRIFMGKNQRRLLATVNKLFGNLLFVSDDISRYKAPQMEFFRRMLINHNIRIESAQYERKNVVRIDYTLDQAPHTLVFDVKRGKILRGELI